MKLDLHLVVTKIQILRIRGTDKISFQFEGPSPFPEMESREPGKYPAEFFVETRRGYAESYLRKLGINPSMAELVQVEQNCVSFSGDKK